MPLRYYPFFIVSVVFLLSLEDSHQPVQAQPQPAQEKKDPTQPDKKESGKDPAEKKAEAKEPFVPDEFSVTKGTVAIAGKKIDYQVTTGRMPVMDMTKKAKAKMFFMAYKRITNEPAANRPLMFCFNGGPGSASVWVHIGLFGPRRVQIDEDGKSLPLPAKLIDNEYSLLDVADLVFIDPIKTGYSRADDPKDTVLFQGLEEDTQSVGDFIRQYVAQNERAASPVFIAGESYGTTRAASLSSYLQSKGGVKVAGIILISSVLDWETIRFDYGNDMPYPLFLPTYTAAAWHHKKIDRGNNLVSVLDEAETFANGPYLAALRKGNLLTDEERRSTAKTMAKFTGLSEDYLVKSDLRVEATRFRTELLRDSGEVIGRYDSRVKAKSKGFTGKGKQPGGKGDPDAGDKADPKAGDKGDPKNAKGDPKGDKGGFKGKGGGGGGFDPTSTLFSAPFGDSIKRYIAYDLNFKTEMTYNTLVQVQPWSYGKAGTNRYANVAQRLRSAMEKDKNLRVLVASGYSDLATPYAATKYTFAHLGPRPLMDRVTMCYYESGHMMYTHQPSLRKQREDLSAFILQTIPKSSGPTEKAN